MLQACRPAGRPFYLALAVAAASIWVGATPQGGPTLTNVVDTVYRADECLNASTWCKQPPTANSQPSS